MVCFAQAKQTIQDWLVGHAAPGRDVGFHLGGGEDPQSCSDWQEGRRVSALPLSFLTLVFHFLFPLSDLWYLMIRCHGGQAQQPRSTGSFQGQWEGRTTKPAFTHFTLGQTLPNSA